MKSGSDVAKALGIARTTSPHVRISDAVVARFATQVRLRVLRAHASPQTWGDPQFWNAEGSRAERSQFFAIGNAINFRFWSFHDREVTPAKGFRRGLPFRGAMYMWRSLRIALDEQKVPLLDASFLASLDRKAFNGIFRADDGSVPLEVGCDERIANLRDLGERLCQEWHGQFINVVNAASGSLVSFVRLSQGFRAFDDPVFKLTMVNAILHSGSGVASFHEEPLPGIDYHLLKQLLRHGVLEPSNALREKLVSHQLLSAEEGLALRQAALFAFVEISRVSGINGELLDNLWWTNRTRCNDELPICQTESAPECPFLEPCQRLIQFELPLEITRYY